MIYLQLFWSFLQIGLFSVGGGYAAMPLIQAQTVQLHGWLTMNEFTDLVTIAEMTPGPIAVNSATFVGIRIAGLPGALVATLGCIFPSLFIVSLLAFIYYRYKNLSILQSVLASLRPAVVALIASPGGLRRSRNGHCQCQLGWPCPVCRRLCRPAGTEMEPHSGDGAVWCRQPVGGTGAANHWLNLVNLVY